MRTAADLVRVIALLIAMPFAAFAADPPASPKSPANRDDYRPAQLMTTKVPQYPAKALRNRIEGTVVVRFEVDDKGKVMRARISRGIEELNNAALEAVRGWKFRPAVKAGRPVEVTLEAPVTFQLPEK